jgi:hypothetical protein
MPTYLTILILAAALVFGLWLPWYLKKQKQQWRSGMDILQQRYGWIIEDIKLPAFGIASSRFTVRDTAGVWRVESRLVTGSNASSGTAGQQVEFRTALPHAEGGTLMIGPPMPKVDLGFMSSMMGMLVVKFLAKVSGLSEADLSGLRMVETTLPFSVLATPGAEQWVNPEVVAPLYELWTAKYPGEKTHPILILGGGEMRVRLGIGLREPEQIEAFVLLSLAVKKAIGDLDS